MNLLHMKYAVVVAECKSLNKAAESLYVGQSTLSRAIRELEDGLGIDIFERSAKGVALTPDGEVFIGYAKDIINQIDELESVFREGTLEKRRFSISVPRASYITEAFARFSTLLDKNRETEIFYKETNSQRALKNILQKDYKLGIIRYAENFEKYYTSLAEEKGLKLELITEFKYVLMASKRSPLAGRKVVYDDLKDYIEIAHADPYVPSLPFAKVKREELPDVAARRIFVFERCSQFELLSHNPETFMWMSPLPTELIERYGLTRIDCDENKRVYRDALVYGEDYKLSALDRLFIEQLYKVRDEIIGR